MRTFLLAVLLSLLGVLYLNRVNSYGENACTETPLGADEYIFVPMRFGERSVQGLVDTGATGTFMATCVVESLPADIAQKSDNAAKVAMGNGDVSNVTIWVVTFEIGPYRLTKVPVYVTDRLTAPIVIGMDVLAGTNAVIAPGVKKVIFLPPEKTVN
jgi:predicted aspartyl protease